MKRQNSVVKKSKLCRVPFGGYFVGATDTGKSAGTLSPVFFYAVTGSFVNENSVLPVASKSMKAVIDKPRRAAAAFIAALICLFTRIVMLLSDFINSVDINKNFS